MTLNINPNRTLLAVLLILLSTACKTMAADDEHVSLSEYYTRFTTLLVDGPEDEFYEHAARFEQALKDAGMKKEYYKVITNVGFFDISHHHIYRAMQTAKRLDQAVKGDKATQFYYLPTGLMGDIYKECHNAKKAKAFYEQALREVGDTDPKFTILKHMELAELQVLANPSEARENASKAVNLATNIDNTEFLSQALGMLAFVQFMTSDAKAFQATYNKFVALKSQDHKLFSPRFEKLMDMGKAAFDHDYATAESIAKRENMHVNRSLVLVQLYRMMGDTDRSYEAAARHIVELDSLYSAGQDADIDDVASQMEIMRTKQEAEYNKKLADRAWKIFFGFTALYLFVYVMGRRRLMRKIWARNRQLKEALAKAQESDEMKSAFIRNMSHEIRTPLNAISGFSQVLCSPGYDIDDEEKQDLMNRITQNVEVITSIVSELLELSKAESQVTKGDVVPNNVCRAAMRAVEQHNKKGLDLKFETALADDFVMQSNGDNITRMLGHLLENALKFTSQGCVTLKCSRQAGNVLFTVTDTGIGVPAESSEKIFENFTKLSEYTGGIGLGLPICRRLARLHGGDVVLDTDYHDGSRFVLTLPVR